jgi:hypothetical protein
MPWQKTSKSLVYDVVMDPRRSMVFWKMVSSYILWSFVAGMIACLILLSKTHQLGKDDAVNFKTCPTSAPAQKK